MPSKRANVFVSYSRADVLLVSPVVKLLRTNQSLIFQDIDSIRPGKRWQGEIAEALAESQLVVVFWCTHASQSNGVSKEWQAAIEQKKDLLPVLLDKTPLPPQLAEFEWIDFRGTVGTSHSSLGSTDRVVGPDAPRPTATARSSAQRLLLTAGAVVFGIVACLGWLFLRQTGPTSGAPPTIPTPWPTPAITVAPPPADRFGLGLSLLLLLGILLTVCLISLSRKPRASPIESRKRYPRGDIEHIATELEAEILRRATLRREGGK